MADGAGTVQKFLRVIFCRATATNGAHLFVSGDAKMLPNMPYMHSKLQWTLANPNSLGPEPIQISEIFGLVKATAAMCVIVITPITRIFTLL